MEDCAIGSIPHFIADTAIPGSECVWITQSTSWRAACIALWITYPASFTPYSVGLRITLPSISILISDEALISSYSIP